MADEAVETVLREIRERVRAVAGEKQSLLAGEDSSPAAEAPSALVNLEANLLTTARTWNKLPPLTSNRRGALARLELWIKSFLKRITHWYTWEQVNFNAATNNALHDALAVLRLYERRLLDADAQLQHAQEQITSTQHQVAALNTELVILKSEFDALKTELSAYASDAFVEQRVGELQQTLGERVGELQQTLSQRVGELQQTLGERIEHLSEEQRVCYKQLAIEASETSVMSDRARRNAQLRVEQIAAEIETLRSIVESNAQAGAMRIGGNPSGAS